MRMCEFCSKMIEDGDYPSHFAVHQSEIIAVRELMDGVADDLALQVPDIARWCGWITYLLEDLEGKATDANEYEAMLASLRNVLEQRIANRYW